MAEQIYEAWDDSDAETGGIICATRDAIAEHRARHLLSGDAQKLYEFRAHTPEEAAAIHSLRMGWGPYEPTGEPTPCPNCDSYFYPDGSGECWQCGPIC